MTDYFLQTFIYLASGVICVPFAKKLGLGSVLGYLIAGVIIGPITGLVGSETETIQHFAEFGVVMMLFLVGLELEPHILWQMKSRLLGLGGSQLTLTVAVTVGLGILLGFSWNQSLAIGFILALSSTAIVLQTFREKGLAKSEGAQNAFSILLFQDIAVIPILAILPLLTNPNIKALKKSAEVVHTQSANNFIQSLSSLEYVAVLCSSIFFVILAGHVLSRPLFRYVAQSKLREIFTATALLIVVGIAALMSIVGLSPALGTFLAGVVLANSEFRHELEANIEPFKGLLLGLFFITVGAGIDFHLLTNKWMTILILAVACIVIKGAILFACGKSFKLARADLWLLSLSLAQAGEFGFVLLSFSSQHHVLSSETTSILSLVVASSMFMTPALFIIFDRLILPKYSSSETQDKQADSIDHTAPVIIAGIGRFGQIVNRFLTANNISTVVLDHQAGQVELMRKIGIKSYFGDATDPSILHTAGIEQASLMVIAIDDQERTVELVKHCKEFYPNLKLLVRAFDRGHGYKLRTVGVDHIVSETYYSALEMAKRALIELDVHPFRATQLAHTFNEVDSQHVDLLFKNWSTYQGKDAYNSYRKLFIELEQILSEAVKQDQSSAHARSNRGWTPPPIDQKTTSP